MNISSSIKTVKNLVTANSPVLLVGAAITGVVATGVLAAKGGYKARGIIDNYTAETGETPDLQKQVQLTWLCYAAPAVTGASTILSVVGVHTIHTKRHAALAGLYAVANNRLDVVQVNAGVVLGKRPPDQAFTVQPIAGRLVGGREASDSDGYFSVGHDRGDCSSTTRPASVNRPRTPPSRGRRTAAGV